MGFLFQKFSGTPPDSFFLFKFKNCNLFLLKLLLSNE
ncbi:hypothetical protein SAMN04488122_5218 [Chitinophaga arvensicola]|uniref:Uncharacterized protein n=1 Tax=Chitinophaga arvensicola TaxID=29529 RepID=A0A1I0S9S2_9BACT|nr:hypothetical protein SAMN04488122_5218 [Chitinophaga arvensicola]